LASRSFSRSLRNTSALRDPHARALMTASAATAGWRGREGHDWWQHRHGGFGWVGPVFWPFAYYDFYDYALWGYGYDPSFWDYGYDDIYAGIFAPYGYDELAGYLPQYAGTQYASRDANARVNAPRPAETPKKPPALVQMCGQDGRDIAGLPIDQIQQAIAPNDEQRAALDDLANASVKAAQDLKAACPTDIALTAPNRLAAMQQRIEAMIAAVQTVQPALEKFYGLLNDEQKARLNALGQQSGRNSNRTPDSNDQNCGQTQSDLSAWPAAEIDNTVKPTDAQRTRLAALQDAAAKAGEMLKASCAPDNALTPPARLAAVGKRLDTMSQAVGIVRAALEEFYASLNDEQKANFDAIGPQRLGTSESQPAEPQARRRHGRRHVSIEHTIRRMVFSILR
jgi:hypothetical protein